MIKFWKKQQSEFVSRKWMLVLLVVILATIGTFFPPILSVWLICLEKPIIILSGTEYVSILTLVVSAYFGANIWQKHIQGKIANEAPVSPTDTKEENNSEDK